MDICTTSDDRTWKEKLAALPREIQSRSQAKVNEVRDAVAALKPRMNALSARASSSLRSNPVKWAGIAAGAGVGIGLLGRYLRRRSQQRRVPAIVIVEAC
jgi:ElaB/YqjD/DUF883 family membrane-anchored ribosome-binding protein